MDRSSDGQGIELRKLQTEIADPVVCRGRQHDRRQKTIVCPTLHNSLRCTIVNQLGIR
ncbi:hypothetical protein SBA3_400011 [Candidatus Sulfopaludibacter sp. SbA3]|nr:hypothetical protein SBA3_400011 [Candidatus Sulfopaludibacter sp. SbA3]